MRARFGWNKDHPDHPGFNNGNTMENGVPTDQVERLPNGMRVLDRQTFSPIHLSNGDTLAVTYTQHWRDESGVLLHTKRHQLAVHRVTETQTIDTAIIVELDDGSLDALGLKSGVAGIFGESV